MESILTDIPFGMPILHTLFDEFSNRKSPFNLNYYYTIDTKFHNFTSFLGGYVPKFLQINGIEIFDSTTSYEFNKMMRYIPDDILNLNDFDLIIPLGTRNEASLSTIYGHFSTILINRRKNITYIEIYDPKKEYTNNIYNHVKYLFKCSIIPIEDIYIFYCGIQKTEDIINCGYYMFKIIYNYLLLTNENDRYDRVYAININNKNRSISDIMYRFVTGNILNPYEYENIIIDNKYVINYLTVRERDYLYECVKKERIKTKGLIIY